MDYPSIWQEVTLPDLPEQALPERLEGKTDVLVIGSGLCGLLTACRLADAGVSSVTVAEAGGLCSGVTAHTTAKITVQHALIYDRLLRGVGREKAWQYARANEEALEEYAALIERLQIDCEFHRCSSVLYATQSKNRPLLESELEACLRVGLPAVMDKPAELPFAVAGSLWLPDQARFHPMKFVAALLRYLAEKGVRFFPHTRIEHPHGGSDGQIHTQRGDIRADAVVIASHFPFLDKPGFYFARIWQERSYVVALKQVPDIEHMYLGVDKEAYSFRPWAHGVLLGGGSHKAGHEGRRHHFEQLEAVSGCWFPRRQVAAEWSAQDCMTHDGIPYIGRYKQAEGLLAPQVYIATGFNKWGMTSSMAAAVLIGDAILGKQNDAAEVFSPSRFNPGMKAKSFVAETADMLANYIGGYVELAAETVRGLPPGEGRIVEEDGKKVGAYKDTDGTVYTVNPICTHMGCVLEWNRDEGSWDCPCHGSRYDYRGHLLNGPAVKPLETKIGE